MTLTCYAQPDKIKSQLVMNAFAAGADGVLASTEDKSLAAGAVAFYGVRPAWLHLWQQALAERRRWYYLDNAWFDAGRERFFRVGLNAVQSWTRNDSDGRRLAELGVTVQPWRSSGDHVVIAHSSDEYMRCVAGWPSSAQWERDVVAQLRLHTRRPSIIRRKADGHFALALEGAHALVTHSSACAIEALVAGVPVIVTDPAAAAAAFSMRFEQIESPTHPAGREEFANRLADSQWTLDELRAGCARQFMGNQ